MIALALLALLGGVINLPGAAPLQAWLAHTTGEAEAGTLDLTVAALSTLIALAGIGAAYWLYGRYRETDPLAGALFDGSSKAWGIDDLYAALFIRPYNRLTAWLSAADSRVFYGLDDAAVKLSRDAGDEVRKTQTGQLNWNVAGVIGGLIVVLVVVFLERGA